MKVVRIHQFGGPEEYRVEQLPEPSPKPGELAVRVRAVSLNYRDLLIRKGAYDPKIAFPFVPMSDGAGEVIATGEGTNRFKVGDRVAAAFHPGWLSGPPTDQNVINSLGGGKVGMLSEVVVLPESAFVSVPGSLSFEEAATLPCAGVTAWHALVEFGRIQPSDTVLVQGTGGVSVFALQIAKAAGATVIATSSSDEKLKRAIELGASHGINYKTNPDWDKEVKRLTDGRGVDHVVEVGGTGTLAKSLRAIRTGGAISVIGILSGISSELNIAPILMRSLRIQGIYVGSRSMFEDLNRAIEANGLHPVIDRIFKFDEIAEALRHMESGAHFGKIVIQI